MPLLTRMPRGLALDLQEGRMYWAEDGTMKLRSSTLDGQDLQDVPAAQGRKRWQVLSSRIVFFFACQ